MKIAVVALHLNTKGGTQRQALALALAFKKLGHEVSFFTLIADYERCYGDMMKNLEIKVVPVSPRGTSRNPLVRKWMSKTYFKEAAIEIAKKIANDVDIISLQDEESYKVGHYYKKIHKNTRAKTLWTMNDPPISYRSKNSLIIDIVRHVFNFFELLYERPLLANTDKILVLDKRNKELVKNFYHRNSVIIGSGVDYDYFYSPVRKDFHKPIIILGIGIFARYRRFEDIISAISILKIRGYDVQAKIAGDQKGNEEYAGELLHLIRELNIEENILFLGRVSEAELLNLYHTSDIFIFPNHLQTFGLAPAEAMAAGLPVIISQTAGFSDFIENKIHGCIVPPLNPHAIADSAGYLIDNPSARIALANKGQQFVKEKIEWKSRAKEMIECANSK